MYIGVDLGSTNLKAALYDEKLACIGQKSAPVDYIRQGEFVEFDAQKYCQSLLTILQELMAEHPGKVAQIAFTGQAESLVCLNAEGIPVHNAISWMDERSSEECAILAQQFSPELCHRKTGQQAILPTWPATKILWLQRNKPEVFQSVATYMLLKDYVVYCLTGKKCADMSIATFSFYFDIYGKCYWNEMLDAIGIAETQLPPLVEPCTVAGTVLPEIAAKTGLTPDTKVNVGTLDHFAGMIGTGNTAPGGMTLSTGTTMVLTAMAEGIPDPDCDMALHYGFLPDTYIMLPVMESGGVCLDWFRRTCMNNMDYDTLNRELLASPETGLLFLPYLVGTNAPEFDREATGVFFGLRQEHTAVQMAKAVMEGVCFVLRKNVEDILSKGTKIRSIVATGGGAKSPVWCQLQADITGLPVEVPAVTEAGCLGAAMIAAWSEGQYKTLEEAAGDVRMIRHYQPNPSDTLQQKYRKFCRLYNAALDIAKMQ
ncbi:MAG: hypothetical protein IKK11_07545 [Oscillospiraceae bacterium]|nr:hypothetical protein [Oscillospiraceae bacterium]